MQFAALFQLLPCDSPLCESNISRTSIKLDFITIQVCENIFGCYGMLRRFCLTNNAISQPQRITTFCVIANWHIDCLFIGFYMTKGCVLSVWLYVAAVKWWGNWERILKFWWQIYDFCYGICRKKGNQNLSNWSGHIPDVNAFPTGLNKK
jgi:hypothetical protein